MPPQFDPPKYELTKRDRIWAASNFIYTPPYESWMHLRYETIGTDLPAPAHQAGDLWMSVPDRPESHGGKIPGSEDEHSWGWNVCSPDNDVTYIGKFQPLMQPTFGVTLPNPVTDPTAPVYLYAEGYRWARQGGGWNSSEGLGTKREYVSLLSIERNHDNPYDWRYIMEFCTSYTGGPSDDPIVNLNKCYRLTLEFEPVADVRHWTVPGLPSKDIKTEVDVKPMILGSKSRKVFMESEPVQPERSREERNRKEGLGMENYPSLPPFYTKEDYENGVAHVTWADDSMIHSLPLGNNRIAVFSRFEVYAKGDGIWEFKEDDDQTQFEIYGEPVGARFGPTDDRYETGLAIIEAVDIAPLPSLPRVIDYAFIANGEWGGNAGDIVFLDDNPDTGFRVMMMEFMQSPVQAESYPTQWLITIADIDPVTGKITIVSRAPAGTPIEWEHPAVDNIDRTHPAWEDGLYSDWQWYDCGLLGVSRHAALGVFSDQVNGVRVRGFWIDEAGNVERSPLIPFDATLELDPPIRPVGTWMEYHGRANHFTKMGDGRILGIAKGEDSRGIARIVLVNEEERKIYLGPQSIVGESWNFYDEYMKPNGFPVPEGLYTVENIQLTGWDGSFDVSVHGDRLFAITNNGGGYTARAPNVRLFRINDDDTIDLADYRCINQHIQGGIQLDETRLLAYDYTWAVTEYTFLYDALRIVLGAAYVVEVDIAGQKFADVYGIGPTENLPYGWPQLGAINEHTSYDAEGARILDLRRRFPLYIPTSPYDDALTAGYETPEGEDEPLKYGLISYGDFDVNVQDSSVADNRVKVHRVKKTR